MRVTTDSKHYENMAAKIREKTGTDATYKPSEMPSGVDEVYKAGQSSMVDESKLIPKTVSGSYISVDDVSEIPHSVGCKVESVNLLKPTSGSITKNGVTFAFNNDNSVTISGVPTTSQVSITFSQIEWDESLGSLARLSVRDVRHPAIFFGVTQYDSSGKQLKVFYMDSTIAFNTEAGCKRIRVDVFVANNFDGESATFYPMLNRGTEALPYTPYVSPESVKVTRCGRNLLNPNNFVNGEVVEYNGVPCYKYTDNKNFFIYNGVFKENTQYTFSLRLFTTNAEDQANVEVVYTDGTRYTIYARKGIEYVYVSTAGKTISRIQGSNNFYVTVYIDLSFTQLNEGTTALPYEPYNGQTLTPLADGTVEGMTSVSPYMNIFTDTEGVNIEATYNKSYGMQTEYDRFWDAFQSYGKRDNYYVAFFAGNLASSCWNNDNFKPKYPMKPVNAQNMFANINIEGDLTQLADMDFSNATNVAGLMNYCPRITRLGVFDLRKVSTNGIFFVSNCSKLETIDEIIFQNDGSQYSGADGMGFTNCTALKNLKITGKINFKFNAQYSPLSKASITSVINALWEGSSGLTATFKLSAVNTAFETSSGAADGSTSAEFAALVATKTNWTITMV